MRYIQNDGTPMTRAAPVNRPRIRRRVVFMPDWPQNLRFGKGEPTHKAPRKYRFSVTFIDCWGLRGFNRPNPRKDVLFDPPPGPGGRRPTPDSAMRPRAQTCLEYRLAFCARILRSSLPAKEGA